MSSVIDYEECSQCCGMYYTEFNCRTGEEYGVCFSCGKSINIFRLYSDDNKVITDDDGHWKYDSRQTPGYGSYMIRDKAGTGELSAFSEPPSEEEINRILAVFNDDGVDSKNSYLYLWDDKEKKLKVLYGTPEKYDDGNDCDGEITPEAECSPTACSCAGMPAKTQYSEVPF